MPIGNAAQHAANQRDADDAAGAWYAIGAVVIDRIGAPPLFLATAVALPTLAVWFVRGLKRFRRVDWPPFRA